MKPLRFFRLKNVAQSEAHYLHSLSADFDSAALRLGRLVHHKVMGCAPEGSPEAIVFEGGARKGKAWEKFKAEHRGADIFLASENAKANAMADAVRGDALAYDIVGAHRLGNREMTLRWSFGSRACQGTPDIFSSELLADVKTTLTADPRRWLGRYGEIRKRAYHAQLAWYQDAIVACGYPKPERVYIVAVENKPPHPVTVFELDESELEEGRRAYCSWLERVLVAESSETFPAYTQTIVRVVADQDDEAPALTWSDDEDEESEAA